MNKLETLKTWVRESNCIVFFGGAGVSTESGIPDFRSVDGLYHQKFDYPPETIISHSFYERNPEYFFRFYREKMLPLGFEPNITHRILAKWEQEGKLLAVVTQNSSTAPNLSKMPLAFPGAAAAALSSRMWCSMKKGWTSRPLQAA